MQKQNLVQLQENYEITCGKSLGKFGKTMGNRFSSIGSDDSKFCMVTNEFDVDVSLIDLLCSDGNTEELGSEDCKDNGLCIPDRGFTKKVVMEDRLN